jgi:hypothetical protein
MHSIFLTSKARSASIAFAVSTISTALPIKRIEAVPFAKWPEWAKDLARDRQAQDIGIGDTVVHVLGDARSEKFKNWFKKNFGTSCGCTERQFWLNKKYPYA